MLLHFLKTALRFMLRHKGYSLLNLTSLALGLACTILIMVYVRYELSYDRHHENVERLYRVATKRQSSSYPNGIAKITGPWGLAIQREIPEVEEMTRFVFTQSNLLESGEQRFYEPNGFFADSGVFRMFSYPMIHGDKVNALSRPNAIVLTASMAEKYFGLRNPVGQTMMMENTIPLTVTGVIKDVPLTSHFTFDYLLSMGTLQHPDREHWVRWNQFYTYVLLRAGVEPSTVEAKISPILVANMGEQGRIYEPFLQPVADIHLHSNLFREMEVNSDVVYVYIMLSIALFVLMIGCMNFMNIATARASVRAKEVGVRKASGADRAAVSRQFFGESLLLSVMSLPIAALLAEFTLPAFNEVTGRQITIGWLSDPALVIGMLLLGLVVGLLAGAYPSLVLSSFTPADILKGSAGISRGTVLRKVLVVSQFALSAFFLIATGVAFDQLTYIQEKRLGFDKENLLVVPMTDRHLSERSREIKNELLAHPAILRVAATGNMPGGGDYGIPTELVGVPPEQSPPLRMLVGDHDLLPVLGVELASGRMFSRDIASDTVSTYMINEEAARRIGWTDPLSGRIAMPAIDRAAGPVIGVAKDFHFRSMREPIMPLLFFVPPPNWFTSFAVRVAPGRTAEALEFLEASFARFDPLHPFRYTYFDEQFERLHASEERMGHLLTLVSVVAVALACLGLFGLSAYSAERRTKEIGVRKVLGASVYSIAGLLASEFMRLVLFANMIAWPVAYLLMHEWLGQFAYRTSMDMATFVLATVVATGIALLTVGAQAIRAAMANPVRSLRYE